MKRVRWSQLALRDPVRVDDHYADIAPDFADRVEKTVLSAARLLQAADHAGATLDANGTRKWAVDGVPHILLYRPTPDGILIARVHHNRQDWQPK